MNAVTELERELRATIAAEIEAQVMVARRCWRTQGCCADREKIADRRSWEAGMHQSARIAQALDK